MSAGPDIYCRARIRGATPPEAASEAGYAGQASYEARQLFAKCELLIEDMTACPSEARLVADIERAEERIARLKTQLRADREWLRAVRLVMGL